jgi:putative ABC transport system permease protein
MKRIKFFFTILSISISISTIIIVISIASSFKKEIQNDIINYGANIISMDSLYKDEGDKIYFFTLPDIYAIKRGFKEIKKFGIMVSGIGVKGREGGGCVINALVRIEGKKYPSVFEGWSGPFSGNLWGTIPKTKDVLKLRLKKGRFINETDIKLKRQVCVLGNYIYNQVGGEKIIGKKLELREWLTKDRYDQYTFTVIGGLERKIPFGIPYLDMFTEGQAFMESDVNLGVFIPITKLKEEISDVKGKAEGNALGFGYIFLQAQLNGKRDGNERLRMEELIDRIIGFCKEKYGKNNEFYLNYEGNLVDELEKQMRSTNIFIGTIGIISLMASIIGIMSMMLFSVTTRTSEIGIRRAVGARKKDIFLQFLKEAFVITSKGGAGGIILGLIFVFLFCKSTGLEMAIPVYSLILGVGAIVLIGIISGVYPALKAANIPPAVAVKYE